jgi:benzoylformate decarboxylase
LIAQQMIKLMQFRKWRAFRLGWLASRVRFVPTVREASFDLFRAHGMTTMFGNPGSTELPMLADFPGDFRYVLGLQEAVVVGMADGFAQASGKTTVVNLHTAPGVGNAMGAIFNAQANHSPLLITAGQQARAQITLQANLTNRDATRMPHPLVKWSYEPPRAEDVPLALAHGAHLAGLAPRGPVFVSLPMDDWYAEVDEADARAAIERQVTGRAVADPEAVRALAERLDAAQNPVLVAGPDIDTAGAWDTAVALAERQRLPVWASPATGGVRLGFPEDHPNFRGVLPPAIGPVGQTLEGHDLILVVGSSVFPYYPHIPGPLLPEGARLVAITSDHDEAVRAPMGDAIVADVGLTLAALLEAVPESSRPAPEPNPGPGEIPAEDPLNPSTVHSALAEVMPEDAIVVLESPSSTLALRNQLRISRPGSYYFSAGGGLGFGLAASVGVQLAQPDRPVICVLGEGSAQYAITAFWSAVAYQAPVTFLVLQNQEYAILKWFAEVEQVNAAPGLDLPKLDVAAVAEGYGVKAHRARERDEVAAALGAALASSQPELVEVPVAPGMSLF